MVDEKALEDASRAYCDVIRLNYEALPAPLAAKRDEAMRAAITAYLQALSPGSSGETEGWVLVPKEPTEMMVKLGSDAIRASASPTQFGGIMWEKGYASRAYRAMLSAAGER